MSSAARIGVVEAGVVESGVGHEGGKGCVCVRKAKEERKKISESEDRCLLIVLVR